MLKIAGSTKRCGTFTAIANLDLEVSEGMIFGLLGANGAVLSDVIRSIDSFPAALRRIAYVLPLTHANVAVRNVLLEGMPLWQTWPQLLALFAFLSACLAVLVIVTRRGRHAL